MPEQGQERADERGEAPLLEVSEVEGECPDCDNGRIEPMHGFGRCATCGREFPRDPAWKQIEELRGEPEDGTYRRKDFGIGIEEAQALLDAINPPAPSEVEGEQRVRLGDKVLMFDPSKHGDDVRACTGCRECLVRIEPASPEEDSDA